MYRFNSGCTYSLIASSVALSSQQIARNPGYARLPASQSIFFGERGSESFAGYHLVDSGRHLQRAGMGVTAALGETRSAECVQQSEADCLEYERDR